MVRAVSSSSSSQPVVNPGSQLTKDAFLQLLVAQLQNQDPLNPTDTNSMMQMETEMSTVEQLTNLNSSISAIKSSGDLSQAVALLGHLLDYVDASGTPQTGTAGSVTVAADGSVRIAVGSDTIGLSAVRGVK
jgi:flagellar basal-body rod modification protein FlgD